MSSDAAATESSAPVAETFSAEYVAELKKKLDAKSQAEAQLKAKFAVHESRQREQLKDMQPAVQAWIKEGLEAAGDYKHEVSPMAEFGDKLHEAANIDSAMPLARMISCHSAKIKREREEFSQGAATAEALGKANKELDELRADRDTKASRIAELEGLVNERTVAAEKLQEELAKAGVLKDTFEFSKASARETAAQETTGGSASSSSSAPAAPFVDPLLSLVMGRSGSGRIMPSTSSHAILGAAGGSDDISAAIRMA